MLSEAEFKEQWDAARAPAYAAYKQRENSSALSLSDQADAVSGKRTAPSESALKPGQVEAEGAALNDATDREQLMLEAVSYLIRAGLIAGTL